MPLELTLPEATKRLRDILFDCLRRNYGLQADPELNDASRLVIAAMAAANGGECWLGHINMYDESPDDDDDDDGRYEPANSATPLWKWSGRTVCNFGASFVVPRYDAQLEQLIRERDAAPYTSTDADYRRIAAIDERLDAVGGVLLHWS